MLLSVFVWMFLMTTTLTMSKANPRNQQSSQLMCPIWQVLENCLSLSLDTSSEDQQEHMLGACLQDLMSVTQVPAPSDGTLEEGSQSGEHLQTAPPNDRHGRAAETALKPKCQECGDTLLVQDQDSHSQTACQQSIPDLKPIILFLCQFLSQTELLTHKSECFLLDAIAQNGVDKRSPPGNSMINLLERWQEFRQNRGFLEDSGELKKLNAGDLLSSVFPVGKDETPDFALDRLSTADFPTGIHSSAINYRQTTSKRKLYNGNLVQDVDRQSAQNFTTFSAPTQPHITSRISDDKSQHVGSTRKKPIQTNQPNGNISIGRDDNVGLIQNFYDLHSRPQKHEVLNQLTTPIMVKKPKESTETPFGSGKSNTCGHRFDTVMIAIPGCKAKSILIIKCQGLCHSRSIPEWHEDNQQIQQVEHCTCCAPHTFKFQTIRFKCPRMRGGIFRAKMGFPFRCACRPCVIIPETVAQKPYDY